MDASVIQYSEASNWVVAPTDATNPTIPIYVDDCLSLCTSASLIISNSVFNRLLISFLIDLRVILLI